MLEKYYQRLCIKRKKVIDDRGKRSPINEGLIMFLGNSRIIFC